MAEVVSVRLDIDTKGAASNVNQLTATIKRQLGGLKVDGQLIELDSTSAEIQLLTQEVLRAKAALSSLEGAAGLTDPTQTAELQKQAAFIEQSIRYKAQLAAIDSAAISPEDAESARKLAAELNSVNVEKIEQEFRTASGAVESYQRSLAEAEKQQQLLDQGFSAIAVGSGALAGTIGLLGVNALQTGASFEQLESALSNAFGAEQGAAELERIQQFAANTPFQVDALTQSFLKLANRGFVPTNEELTRLGDLAASQAKDFDQLAEAVLDAQTGEFERLKEFGIQASKAGDDVTIAFRGVQQTVENTPEAIREVVLGFGALEGIQGSLSSQSATLAGQYSNLQDNLDQVNVSFFEFAQGGAKALLGAANDLLSGFLALPQPIQNIAFGITGFAGVLAAAVAALASYNLAVNSGSVAAVKLAVAQIRGTAATTAQTAAKVAATAAETAYALATGQATAAQQAQAATIGANAAKLGLLAGAIAAVALAFDTFQKGTQASAQTEQSIDSLEASINSLREAQVSAGAEGAEAFQKIGEILETNRESIEGSIGPVQQFVDKIREFAGLSTLAETAINNQSIGFGELVERIEGDVLGAYDDLKAAPGGLATASEQERAALAKTIDESIAALEKEKPVTEEARFARETYLKTLRASKSELEAVADANKESTAAIEEEIKALEERQKAESQQAGDAQADAERNITRQIDDERRARQEANAEAIAQIEKQNAEAIAQVEKQNAAEVAAFEKQQAAELAEVEKQQQAELNATQQAFDQELAAFQESEQAKLQAQEAAFNESQRAAEEAFNQSQQRRQEALASAQQAQAAAQASTYTEAERIIALQGAQTSEERATILEQQRVANEIANLNLADRIINPDQLAELARQISGVGQVDNEEEARRVQEVLGQIQQQQQQQQQEADRQAEIALQQQLQAEEAKFQAAQEQQRVAFEASLNEQKAALEAQIEQQRLNFETNVLAPLRAAQEAELAALREQQEIALAAVREVQESELAALREAQEAQIAEARRQFEDQERALDRQYEDDKIARERAFREDQRQKDLDNAREIEALRSRGGSGSNGSNNTPIPARRDGGPVRPGQTYLVGEEGPELIVPNRRGWVLTARETTAALASRTPLLPTLTHTASSRNVGDRQLLNRLEVISQKLDNLGRPTQQNNFQIVRSPAPLSDVMRIQGDLLSQMYRRF